MRHPIAGRTTFHGKYPKSSQTKTTYAHFRTVLTSSQNFKKNLHLPSEIFRRFYFPQDLVAPREFSLFHLFPGRFFTQFTPSNHTHTHTNRCPKRVKSHPPTLHVVVIGGLYREDIFPWILLISSGRSQPPPPCIQVAKEPGSARL